MKFKKSWHPNNTNCDVHHFPLIGHRVIQGVYSNARRAQELLLAESESELLELLLSVST